MKKTLLLFLLLPFFGIAQTDFVRWTGSLDLKPTILNNYISASYFTGSGLTTGPTPSYDGIIGTGWPTGASLDPLKYFQVTINPILDGKITLDRLYFSYKGDMKAYQIRYSKQTDFSSPVTIATETNANPYNSNIAVSLLNLGIVVNPGEKIYLRFYAYNGNGNWKIMDNNTLKIMGTVNTIPSPLNGPYKIGSASDAKFPNITEAINALNALGVSGPVTFLIDENQTVTSQLTINQFTGTSATNTVTIKPNNTKTVSITGSIGSGALIALNGADNIIIDGNNTGGDNNLTLYNSYTTGANDNRLGIWLYNDANNNIFRNLSIRMTIIDKTVDVFSAGIFSGGNTIGSSGNNSNNTVSNVIFTETKQPVFVEGGSNWTVSKNTIGSSNIDIQPSVGIYLNNINGYTVSGNTISGITKYSNNNARTAAGLSVLGTSTGGTIYNNIINNVNNTQQSNGSNTAGIFIDNAATSTTTIYNNIISNIYTQANDDSDSNINYKGHGIYIKNGINKLYYNTIAMIPSTQANGRSSCVYIQSAASVDLKNNIFYNSRTSGTQYALYTRMSNTNLTSNYNSFFVTSGNANNIVRYVDTPYKLADWKTIKDANSVGTSPVFTSTYRLNTTDVANNVLKGDPISNIVTDIDGTIRIKPYMGAFEVKTCTPLGDQLAFGTNSWIGYVYKWTSANPPNPALASLPGNDATTYLGTVTEASIFDRNVGNGVISGATINLCGPAPADTFFVRYKMKVTTVAGIFNFSIGGDDGARLYIDGTQVLTRWNDHSFIIDAALITLAAGDHEFVFEYYENAGAARATFSYGQIKGDNVNLPYGINTWNVYGFTKNNLDLTQTVYAGNYVDSSLNIVTPNSWAADKSPSVAAGYQGAPMPVDYFTTSHRRQGFPCGNYQIQLANYDDDVQIYVNGTLKFPIGTNKTAPQYINSGEVFALNKDSKVEVRLREDGGDAKMTVNFVSVPVIYNGVGAPPTNTSAITISSNTTLQSDIEVCSCTVNPGVTLTVPLNKTLTVNETLTVGAGGKLLIEDGGSLLQTSTAANAYQGTSESFQVKRNTDLVRRYDYTYWSAPITRTPIYTMHDLSPNTLLDKYQSYDSSVGAWDIDLNGKKEMKPAIGYVVRAPQSFSLTDGAVYPAVFTGIPNNGDYSVPLYAAKYSLIGNPYPSAIDAQKFISINHNATPSVDVGALYFWTHNTPPSNTPSAGGTYDYTSNDYAVFTLSGSTSTGAKRPDGTYEPAPSGKIASCQSFFMKASAPGVVKFTNDMRIKGGNTEFFKTTKTEELEKNRIWLNLTNTKGAFKQVLVGYIEGATNEWDVNYDAVAFNGNTFVDFYSINDATKLSIQGRALPFEDTDRIPLGYKTTVAGDFTISIDHLDGFFNSQGVYLEDRTTGKITDLKAGDYTFTTAIGTFADRFTISYIKKTLGTGDFESTENDLLVSVKDKTIKVTSTKENIKEVAIYDISGKLLYNKKKVDTAELQIENLQSSTQVLLVKVTLDNDYVITKKIIFN
ncbi:T9SS sorting signal type C domain-containing protein [uncultured Flavobacterium sp.]|uniref:T9SS sorting signal type C domain-containing protein n=1 Tax=uncultured Flavobacterium sp. TaxID=165435 RepID=UPI0030820B8C